MVVMVVVSGCDDHGGDGSGGNGDNGGGDGQRW